MQCEKCQADVPVTARFCPTCAAPVLKEGDVKSPSEVSVEWLKAILETQGYNVEVGTKDPETLIAKHDNAPNLMVSLRKKISLITFQSLWNMKKPSWGQKNDFLTAINKANSLHWLCACYSTEELDSFNVSTALYMTERLSSRDIAAFIDLFVSGINTTIDNSGIRKFA
jgi:hypothetical protein